MYSTQKNRIYRWALACNIWYLYVVLLLVMAVSLAGAYAAYWFMEQNITAARSRVCCLNEQYAQLHIAGEKHKKNQQHKQEKENCFNGYSFACAPSFNQDQVSIILAHVRRIGLKLTHLTKQKDTDKSWYKRKDIELGIKGTLEQITQLFHALSKEGKLMQCKRIECQADQNGLYVCSSTIGCIGLCKAEPEMSHS